MVWLAGPRIQSTWSKEGKKVTPRGPKPAINKTSKQPTCKYGVFQYCNLQDWKFRKDFKIAICKTWSLEWISRLQSASLQALKGIEDFNIRFCKRYPSHPGGLQGGRRIYIFFFVGGSLLTGGLLTGCGGGYKSQSFSSVPDLYMPYGDRAQLAWVEGGPLGWAALDV